MLHAEQEGASGATRVASILDFHGWHSFLAAKMGAP
jgi:hypothetical protein